tara:strand:- start:75401 stop:75769 length:369 start_codon:yes stop_codon:yes gene_type:complete
MKLLTKEQRERLLKNGAANAARLAEPDNEGETHDFYPVVKLFCPWGGGTWLLTELDPEEPDIAFGLCDLGVGCPEMGTVRLSELEAIRGPAGLRIERDRFFKAKKSLSAYASEASQHGCIVV